MTTQPASRRRGEVLVQAIFDATLSELAANGYDGLSIERVAEVAQTGKASIYRRWPTKRELTLAAIEANLPDVVAAPGTGDVRSDLLAILRRIAKHLNSRSGGAMSTCLLGVKSHADLAGAVRTQLLAPRKRVLHDIISAGIARGEVRADVITDRILELGPRLLLAERLERGRSLRDAEVVAILDEVLMPILRPRSS